MIVISAERCDGCGACVEVCPEGAIYLVDGKATVDGALCRDCEACMAACPREAIVHSSQASIPQATPVRVPVPRPEPAVIQVKTQIAPEPLRARVLPVVGAALVWAGREIVPRLADYALYGLDRRAARKQATTVSGRRLGKGSRPRDGRGGGRGGGRGRRRRRRRDG